MVDEDETRTSCSIVFSSLVMRPLNVPCSFFAFLRSRDALSLATLRASIASSSSRTSACSPSDRTISLTDRSSLRLVTKVRQFCRVSMARTYAARTRLPSSCCMVSLNDSNAHLPTGA